MTAKLKTINQANDTTVTATVIHAQTTIDPHEIIFYAENGAFEHRKAVAMNPSCTEEALTVLFFDNNPKIRNIVSGHKNLPGYLKIFTDLQQRYTLNSEPAELPLQATADECDEHADSEETQIRAAVAAHPATRPATLARLANDKHDWVKAAVAQNPNTPKEALTILAENEHHFIRDAVLRNPSTPAWVRTMIQLKHPNG